MLKNAIREIQQSNTEIVKEARGRKAGAQIPGIISNNEGVIKALIESYILDAKEQNIKTCKDSLARYIEEKKTFWKNKKWSIQTISFQHNQNLRQRNLE
ncbi:hypothetical protein ACIXFY_19890 [Bacteroides fragilis]